MMGRELLDKAVFYHWWGGPHDKPYQNMSAPILLSIATLRACNPSIPIFVLDGTKTNRSLDWAHFKEKLRFKTIPIQFVLDEKLVAGAKHLSRLYDLEQYSFANLMIYCDSDVFWLKDPLPVDRTSGFCFDGHNTGYFYYHLHDCLDTDFFRRFRAYSDAAIFSENIRAEMKKFVGYDAWYGVWDEMILCFMKHEHPGLFSIVSKNENFSIRDAKHHNFQPARMLHCNGLMMRNRCPKKPWEAEHSRGLIPLVVKEFYNKLMQVLDEADLGLIYSQEELVYRDKQISLFEQMEPLLATMDEQGLYHLDLLVE